MAVFVIGDLHLALGCNKPMDVFEGWDGYVARLQGAWRERVAPEDTVVLAGDTSWGMSLPEALADFQWIDALPGRKVLLKGNHDYWWSTAAKMEAFFTENGLHSLALLHNNYVPAGGLALCGTRGWWDEDGEAHTQKMIQREAGRLGASLAAARKMAPEAQPVVILHYPPFGGRTPAAPFFEVMQAYGVQRCYYGHLHGQATRYAPQGIFEGIACRLISADAVGFIPQEIVVEN